MNKSQLLEKLKQDSGDGKAMAMICLIEAGFEEATARARDSAKAAGVDAREFLIALVTISCANIVSNTSLKEGMMDQILGAAAIQKLVEHELSGMFADMISGKSR